MLNSIEISKSLPVQFLPENKVYFQEELNCELCSCDLCQNDLKPISQISEARKVHADQFHLKQIQAYEIVVQALQNVCFENKIVMPDTYFIKDNKLIYLGKRGLRKKNNQTNLQIKKHFQEKRRKLKEDSIDSNRQKEVGLLTFIDCNQQILSESLMNKLLDKRRNDSFWDDIHRICLIPFEVRQMHTQLYVFQRNNSNQKQIQDIMQELANKIDQQVQRQNNQQQQSSFLKTQEDLFMSMSKSILGKFLSSNSIISKTGSKKNFKIKSQKDPLMIKLIEKYSLQLIAYLEIVFHIRVFKLTFEYLTDLKTIYLSKVMHFIGLKAFEHKLIHDRHKPLPQIHTNDLIETKIKMNEQEVLYLWKACTGVLVECLEKRRTQLKLNSFHRPNPQMLKQIFQKIIPNFSTEKILKNENWKNQYSDELEKIKIKINKIIREDEGIRILKRYNIYFSRTFQPPKKYK